MNVTVTEAQEVMRTAERLYAPAEVEQALERMAAEITTALAKSNPLVVTVLTGAIIPAGLLMTKLHFPLQSDYLHATRYRGDTEGRDLHWLVRPRSDLRGRTVLIVDDILDEGPTLQAIVAACRQQGAAAVYTAVLVKKNHNRNIGIEADFVGLETGDRYLFGYGMDYHDYWRNAPGIFAVKGM
ncbi:MAG: hypoxanthine-guanine phosphoribosyltransferase [Gammaproteobacteria bacterium]|nr:hypoxanthine-guanine phosphoribosyltransferase [Gammaproteobacteria bacterium]